MDQTSACLELLCTGAVDLSLNIDLVRRLGTSVLQTHYCELRGLEAIIGDMSPHERIVATNDPGSLRKLQERLPARLYGPTSRSDYSLRQVCAICG